MLGNNLLKKVFKPKFTRPFSLWTHVTQAAPDPTIAPREGYEKDTHPQKVLLGQGTYKCDKGKPYILDCVTQAKQMIFDQQLGHEYSGIDGNASFNQKCIDLIYGKDSETIKSKRIATC